MAYLETRQVIFTESDIGLLGHLGWRTLCYRALCDFITPRAPYDVEGVLDPSVMHWDVS